MKSPGYKGIGRDAVVTLIAKSFAKAEFGACSGYFWTQTQKVPWRY